MNPSSAHLRPPAPVAPRSVGGVRPPYLDDPVHWDAISAIQPWDTLLAAIPARLTDPVTQARRGQLLLSSRDQVRAQQGVELLSEQGAHAPASGLYLMALAELGHHEQVRASGYQRRGYSPLELEDAVHAHAGLAVSCGALGLHLDAYAHVMIALEHARGLGLTHRTQYLSLLRLHLLSMTGQPDPDSAGGALCAPMPPARRAFGLRAHAGGLMALGDYRAALQALGPASADDQESSDMRATLALTCGLPVLRAPSEGTEWGQLALGLQRLIQGSSEVGPLLSLVHEPVSTAGRIVAALMLARGHGYDQHALRSLGPVPTRPDQRAMWEIVRWVIDWQAGRRGDLVGHARRIEEACRALRCPAQVLGVLAAIEPELYVLLCHTPVRIDGLGSHLPAIPLLWGDEVVHRGVQVPVPGRIGRVLVSEALGIPDDTLDPTERRRYRRRLAEHGVSARPVNLGAVVRALRDAQPGPVERGAWESAQRATVGQLSASVREQLHHFPL